MTTGTGLILQYIVVALAVLLSAWVVMKQQAPQLTRRARIRLAVPLVRAGRPAWLQALGHWIAPAPQASGSTCGGCDSCGPPPR